MSPTWHIQMVFEALLGRLPSQVPLGSQLPSPPPPGAGPFYQHPPGSRPPWGNPEQFLSRGTVEIPGLNQAGLIHTPNLSLYGSSFSSLSHNLPPLFPPPFPSSSLFPSAPTPSAAPPDSPSVGTAGKENRMVYFYPKILLGGGRGCHLTKMQQLS